MFIPMLAVLALGIGTVFVGLATSWLSGRHIVQVVAGTMSLVLLLAFIQGLRSGRMMTPGDWRPDLRWKDPFAFWLSAVLTLVTLVVLGVIAISPDFANMVFPRF